MRTVPQAGWAGVENGELLRRAEGVFDVFVTIDRKFGSSSRRHAQRIAVVVISAQTNRLADLRELVPSLLRAVERAAPGDWIRVP